MASKRFVLFVETPLEHENDILAVRIIQNMPGWAQDIFAIVDPTSLTEDQWPDPLKESPEAPLLVDLHINKAPGSGQATIDALKKIHSVAMTRGPSAFAIERRDDPRTAFVRPGEGRGGGMAERSGGFGDFHAPIGAGNEDGPLSDELALEFYSTQARVGTRSDIIDKNFYSMPGFVPTRLPSLPSREVMPVGPDRSTVDQRFDPFQKNIDPLDVMRGADEPPDGAFQVSDGLRSFLRQHGVTSGAKSGEIRLPLEMFARGQNGPPPPMSEPKGGSVGAEMALSQRARQMEMIKAALGGGPREAPSSSRDVYRNPGMTGGRASAPGSFIPPGAQGSPVAAPPAAAAKPPPSAEELLAHLKFEAF